MQKKQKKEIGNMPDRQNKRNNMKKVPQNDSYNLVSSDSNEYQELFNIIHTKKQKEAKSKNQRTQSNNINIEHQEEEKTTQETLPICLVCLEDSFEGGKCRLICRHVFCGDCTSHWQQIIDKCPACNRKISQIVYQLGGQERTKKIKFAPFIPNCQKCGRNNDYNQMYFCDDCNRACIHTYCQASLMNENKSEQWVCQNCIYSNYHENKYQSYQMENLGREEQYEDDGFIVPDSYQDFRQDLEEVVSRDSGFSKKEAKANQKKVLRPMGKKKDKAPKSRRR